MVFSRKPCNKHLNIYEYSYFKNQGENKVFGKNAVLGSFLALCLTCKGFHGYFSRRKQSENKANIKYIG